MAFIMMGGSFSPPTIAHMEALRAAARFVARTRPETEIYAFFVPVSKEYNKPSVKEECISEPDRLVLIQLAATILQREEKNPRIHYDVSDHEIREGRAVKTYDSVHIFAKKTGAKPADIYVAMGEDNVIGLMKGGWYRSAELLHEAKILYFSRADSDEFRKLYEAQDDVVKGNIIRVDTFVDMPDVSSTEFRKALMAGTNTSKYAPKNISNMARGSYKNIAKCGGRRRKRRTHRRRC